MRVVSDFREAMWGVLQQGISTLDVDFVAYAGEHFERLLGNASTPGFEPALRPWRPADERRVGAPATGSRLEPGSSPVASTGPAWPGAARYPTGAGPTVVIGPVRDRRGPRRPRGAA